MTALSLKRHSRGLGLSPRRHRGASGAAPAYAATPVSFDGATHLTRGDALTGVSDSKVWSGSMWLRWSRATGADTDFFRLIDAGTKFQLLSFGATGGDLALFGFNAAGAEILDWRAPDSSITDDNWHHFLWSIDLATATAHGYLDDAAVTPVAGNLNLTNDTIDFTVADVGVGANTAGSNKFAGDMADIWMRFGGAVIDFSVEANRRQFITADGTPANPAGYPSGGQIILNGPLASWHTNDGTGGGMTVASGALAAGSSPVKAGVGP